MATGRVPTTANSPLTAKGDLFTYSTAPARLAVGNSGEQIVADSAATTGLRYQGNFAAGKNVIINGAFNVWQRGTSITPAATGYFYGADRFLSYNYSGTTCTISQQTFTPGSAPVAAYESQYFMRVSSTNTATYIGYRIEDVRTLTGTVTLSFWAKSNAGQTLSSLSLEQVFGSGGSSPVTTAATAPTLTTSWARYSFTFTIPTFTGKTIGANSYIQLNLAGAASNAIDIWGVQIESGSVATAFQTATGTLQGELAAAMRYYEKSYPIGTAAGTSTAEGLLISYGSSDGSNTQVVTVGMQVPKRNLTYSAAVYTQTGTANNWAYNRSGAAGNTAMTIDLKSERTFRTYGVTGATWAASNLVGHWVVDNEL